MIQSSEALREATPRLPGGQSIKLIQAQSAGWIDARVRRKPNEGGAPLAGSPGPQSGGLAVFGWPAGCSRLFAAPNGSETMPAVALSLSLVHS